MCRHSPAYFLEAMEVMWRKRIAARNSAVEDGNSVL
jgi:hypothetical protein